MLTDAPWLTENNPISAMERGVGAGLQARAQDLGAMNAGQALKLSYDQLSASQEIERRKALLSAGQINADQALTAYKQDALSQYRQEQIADAQQRIKDQEAAHTAAADLLKSTHDDTAAFVEDAKKMGAADALEKHPKADKTVVNHVMSLEAEKPMILKPNEVGYIGGKPVATNTFVNPDARVEVPPGGVLFKDNTPIYTNTNFKTPKKLDEATAADFLKQAKGDKDKARKLARDAGYTF